MPGRKQRSGPFLAEALTHCSIVTWEKGHVRAAVVALEEGSAELLGVAAAPVHGISRTSHPDLDRWLAGCDRALTQAEDMTVASAGRKLVPDDVVMSVPGEITRSLPIIVSRERSDPHSAVSIEELCALVQRGYRKAQDVIGSALKGPAEDFIYGSIAEVMLDDQVVDDAVGLRGARLALTMNFHLAPLEWIRALEIVAERLELNLVAIVPQHAALVSPLPDPVALLVLLDEQHTILGLARRGRLQWDGIVELGERQMSEPVAGALNLQGRQAEALMRAYRARQLREEVELQLGRVFWVELRRWMRAMAERVASARNVPLPHHIYFWDQTQRIPECLSALQTPFWEQSLPFNRCPEITEYSANTLGKVVDGTSQATGPAYWPLRALALHVAQLYAPCNILARALVETVSRSRPPASARLH